MIFRCLLGATLLLAAVAATRAAPAPSDKHDAASGNSALGGKHDNSAPINISSDNFVGDTQTKIGTYIGNVVVIQGDYKLRADKMNVHVVDGKASVIDGAGNVLFNSGIETASGDTGIYDLNAHTITMDGRVVLTKAKDVMRGTHMVMNLDTHKALLTAKGMPGGGRVQGLFIPADKGAAQAPSQSQTTGKSPGK